MPRFECTNSTVLDGYKRLDVYEVFSDGARIVVLGRPDEASDHNCDRMGCGWDHVIVRAKIERADAPRDREGA